MAQRSGFVFGARLLLALVVVLATFNPTGHSFFHWVRASLADGSAGPVHAFVGVVLGLLWRRLTGRVEVDESGED